VEETLVHLERLYEEWFAETGNNLSYKGGAFVGGGGNSFLIKNFGDKGKGIWEALVSMRNVETDCQVRVIGE